MLDRVICYKTATFKTIVDVVLGSLGQVIVEMVVSREPLAEGAEVHNLSFRIFVEI